MRKQAEVKNIKTQIEKKEKEILVLKKRIANLEQGNIYDIGEKAKTIISAKQDSHSSTNGGEEVL